MASVSPSVTESCQPSSVEMLGPSPDAADHRRLNPAYCLPLTWAMRPSADLRRSLAAMDRSGQAGLFASLCPDNNSLAIIMITTALVGGLARRGTARATWIGFAVFGWIYLLIDQLPAWPIGGLGAGPIPKPVLLIEYGIARLRPYINPLSATLTGSEWVQYEQVSFSLGIILFGLLGAVLGRLVAVKDDPPISS